MLTGKEIRQEAEIFERDLKKVNDIENLLEIAKSQNLLILAIAEGIERCDE